MNAIKFVALVFIAGGIWGLIYDSFSYTKEVKEASIGSVELLVKDQKTVNIPVWAGIGAIVFGGALLLFASQKKIG